MQYRIIPPDGGEIPRFSLIKLNGVPIGGGIGDSGVVPFLPREMGLVLECYGENLFKPDVVQPFRVRRSFAERALKFDFRRPSLGYGSKKPEETGLTATELRERRAEEARQKQEEYLKWLETAEPSEITLKNLKFL